MGERLNKGPKELALFWFCPAELFLFFPYFLRLYLFRAEQIRQKSYFPPAKLLAFLTIFAFLKTKCAYYFLPNSLCFPK